MALAAALALFGLSAVGQVAGAESAVVGKESATIYTESFAALTKLFVLAVLVENALALIFNWRVFLEFFNKRAIKTVVMFLVSLAMVTTFDIDIIADLMAVYNKASSSPGDVMSTTLTALIVAGGSSGVNNLLMALGFRSRLSDEIPRPPKTEAWIAILVERDSAAIGEVLVQIIPQTAETPAAKHNSIAGSLNARKKLKNLFFPNRNRFPTSGGYKVESGKIYRISVSGKDSSGEGLTGLGDTYSFAPGAIVDLDVKLERNSTG